METCDVVMWALWYQTVYPRPGGSLIDILTQFYTGHYNVSSAVAGEGGGQSVECAADGVRGGLCLWTSDIFPGDIYLNTGVTSESQSLPSFTDHTPALSLVSQCVQHSNSGRGNERCVKGLEGEMD